ncbi:MAG: hypothetical protein ISS63_08460 [Desulfobacteraceae bacterium]|nr:hypothetical protein [Desulfobacteraceae bacterium]
MKRKIDSEFNVKFDLELGKSGIFNFVFNFVDDSNFNMLRLDSRDQERTPNALLFSRQRFHWYIVAEAEERQPPHGVLRLEIEIKTGENRFRFMVNGKQYTFFKENGEKVDLTEEFRAGFKVGWFNENAPVKLSNIEIN